MSASPSFLRSVWLSCTSPAYYRDVRGQPAWISWRYLILLLCCVAVVSAATVMVRVASFDVPALIRSVHAALLEEFPADLEITVEKSGLSVNQNLPYRVPMPSALLERGVDFSEGQEPIDTLVVFTSDAAIRSVQDFWEYKAFLVITETAVYGRKDNGQITVQDISVFTRDLTEPVVLNRTFIESAPVESITKVWFLQRWFTVPLAGMLAFVVLLPAFLLITVVTLLLYTLFLWLVLHIAARGSAMPFGMTYRTSMHAYTPVLLLHAFTSALHGILALVLFLIFATTMVVRSNLVCSLSARPSVGSGGPVTARRTAKSAAKRTTGKRATKG